jgi:hypothetical protein
MPGLPGPSHSPTPGLGGELLLTFKSGAGFLAAPNNVLPAAFKSLHDVKVYFKGFGPVGYHVYSMNGVSPSTAICVLTIVGRLLPTGRGGGSAGSVQGLLYTSPSAYNNAWYYLTNFLTASPGPLTGPVVKSLDIAQYVAIANNPSRGSHYWAWNSDPDMKQLILL